jgi:hypothetical protein
VLSVANSVDAESKIDGAEVTIDGSQELFGVTRAVRYDWKNDSDLSGPVVAAPPENETACSPYPANTFDGKVVLVKWHDAEPECGSIARGENLSAAGAVGFIFASDSETFSAGINGSDTIPGVLMVATGADAIRDALDNSFVVTADATVTNSVIQSFPDNNDKVSASTSRGIHAAGNVKPDVAAVGSSIFSTAVGTGDDGVSYSGTSMASPMVAGLAALVRQANPEWTPLQVKADIMNTAGHDLFVGGSANPSSDRFGPPRVGAGRIDAEDAVANEVLAYDPANGVASVSFGPVAAEAPVTLSREVTVDNQSALAVTYDVSYDPINEVPGAVLSVTPSQVSLDPDETDTVTVSLEISDPKQLTKAVDPTVGRFGTSGFFRETLAEAFGRLLLEPTVPGLTLRVPVYATPRPVSAMTQPDSLTIHRLEGTATDPTQQATIELTGTGVGTGASDNGRGDGDPNNDIRSIAAGFELLAESGQSPECSQQIQTSCWRLPEERNADIKMVGYTSDAPGVSDPADALGYFALSVHAPWSIPSDKLYLQVDLDVNGDDDPDLFLYNSRLGDSDVFVSTLLDPAKPSGQRVIDQQLTNGRFGNIDTALYDSDVMVLPILLDALADYGVTPANPRVSYGVETYSAYSDQPIDLIAVDAESEKLVDPPSVNLFEPGLTVTDSDENGPLVSDQPDEQLTVTKNIASYAGDSGKGLMMVHFHNQAGAKAQAVELQGAATATELIVTPGALSARVDAVPAGLPEPSGAVIFLVDGTEIGEARIEGGIAVLSRNVANGATRQIEASYPGDADFDPSSDQVSRSDPTITVRISSKGKKNSRGWYRTPVTVSFRCQASGSQLTEDCPYPRRLTRDGRGLTVSKTIVAFDGGKATARLRGINLDRTRPVVRIRGVKRGMTYTKLRRARCVARDRTSGVLGCRIIWKRRGSLVVYRATATDKAGNRRTVRLRTRLLR